MALAILLVVPVLLLAIMGLERLERWTDGASGEPPR
jgi:hypothetical protein